MAPLPKKAIERKEGKVYASRHPAHAHEEPDYGQFCYEMPSDFGPAEQKAWTRWLPDLLKTGIIESADWGAFETLCRLYGKTAAGKLSYAAELSRYLGKFGFSPADRRKVEAKTPPETAKTASGLSVVKPRTRNEDEFE